MELRIGSGDWSTAITNVVHLLHIKAAAAVGVEADVAMILGEGGKSGSDDSSLFNAARSTSLIYCNERLRMTPDIRAIAEKEGLVVELDLSGSFVSRVHDTGGEGTGKGGAGTKRVQEIIIGGSTDTQLEIASESMGRRRKAGGGEILFCG